MGWHPPLLLAPPKFSLLVFILSQLPTFFKVCVLCPLLEQSIFYKPHPLTESLFLLLYIIPQSIFLNSESCPLESGLKPSPWFLTTSLLSTKKLYRGWGHTDTTSFLAPLPGIFKECHWAEISSQVIQVQTKVTNDVFSFIVSDCVWRKTGG